MASFPHLWFASRAMAGSDRFPLRRLWASESKVQQVRPTRRQTSKSGLDTFVAIHWELAYWPADLSRHGGKVVRQILGCRPEQIWIQFSIESAGWTSVFLWSLFWLWCKKQPGPRQTRFWWRLFICDSIATWWGREIFLEYMRMEGLLG